MKQAPLEASEIVLFKSSFVSRSEAAGDPVSFLYDRRLPPTTIRTLQCSVLQGLWLYTNNAYVMSLFGGTSILKMKEMVLAGRTS